MYRATASDASTMICGRYRPSSLSGHLSRMPIVTVGTQFQRVRTTGPCDLAEPTSRGGTLAYATDAMTWRGRAEAVSLQLLLPVLHDPDDLTWCNGASLAGTLPFVSRHLARSL